jgi:2,4-dienoyl-CoA reductase-like NADH-dependent reductase (Old Yellow Enzyme family)
VVSPDSPQAFGNIILYKDEVVRWPRELSDAVHGHGAAVMIQITHLAAAPPGARETGFQWWPPPANAGGSAWCSSSSISIRI